jgi:UDP-N-acetylmuramoyl-tripeptide--D-alanyl-D-alanine ligase
VRNDQFQCCTRLKFLVQELVRLTEEKLFRDWNAASSSFQLECSFSIDSRTIQPGQIFIALRGSNADGHDYLAQALEKGACGLIISNAEKVSEIVARPSPLAPRPSPFIIQVTDTLQALHAIARACRQKHPIPLAAITGSNGKTTVKDMAAAILTTRYHVLKSQKSLNNPIGLPLTLANMTEQHEIAVLEMGMNAPGEIRKLAEIARPDVGAITNIAPAHFGFFHSLEAIMWAKLELFESLPVHGMAVLNTDDELFEQMAEKVRCAMVTFGTHPANYGDGRPLIFLENLTISQDAKYSFELHTPKGIIPINLPLPGYHNVLNALAATAVVFALHCLELEAIKEGLEHFQPSPMRMQVTTHHNVTIINDAYNANPASMASAFHTLKMFPCAGKKIAVLGDMLELGQISQSAHYDVGKLAAEVPVDHLFLLGEYAEHVAQGAQVTGMAKVDIFIGKAHEQLAHELTKHVGQRDLILFKASRGMALEKVIDAYVKMLNTETEY